MAGNPLVKGFAVGRTIFSNAAQRWLRDEMPDDQAVADMAARFGNLVAIWKKAKAADERGGNTVTQGAFT